jgi:glutamate N-acetyltransferase/amino-acid N-acetyltransferase
LINSGNANACTGEQGFDNAIETQKFTAEHLGISIDEVLVSSTGVIGQQLNVEKVKEGINSIRLSSELSAGHDVLEAIMTTDNIQNHLHAKSHLKR